MFTDQPYGEVPPTEVLQQLRAIFLGLRHSAADWAWHNVATGAVTVFETYHRG